MSSDVYPLCPTVRAALGRDVSDADITTAAAHLGWPDVPVPPARVVALFRDGL